MRTAFLLAALLLASGCLQRGPDRPDYEGIAQETETAARAVLIQDHGVADGHLRAALHRGAHNLELVGYSNGVDRTDDPDSLPPAGSYTELAVADDYAYQARSSPDGSFGGFVIYDIRDPSDPFPVGEFYAQGGSDIEVNRDQTLAFLATQRNAGEQMLGAIQGTQDPAAGAPRGIYVVDISDKAHPTLDTFVPLPYNGPHTITYHEHEDGNDYLIACTYDLVTDPATGAIVSVFPVTQRVVVYQVQANPSPIAPPGQVPGVALNPVSEFQITDSPPPGQMFFPHDTRVQSSGNATYLYVAYWDKGVRILDFSDPMSTPVLEEAGGHTEFSPSALNAIHLAQPFDAPIDGRHVTVTEPEIIQAEGETGQITFLDTSSPGDIERLGSWTLPEGDQGQLGVTAFDFSPHNFDTWDGKVALAHYHAGVWVIDAGDGKNLREPKTVGWYMPAKARTDSPVPQPNVWGVFEHNGLLYVSDEATGLYVLRYTGP